MQYAHPHPIFADRPIRAERARRRVLGPRRLLICMASTIGCLLCGAFAAVAGAEQRGGYSPTRILVRFSSASAPRAHAAVESGDETSNPLGPGTHVVPVARGEAVSAALARLRRRSDVVWAVPDYRAHAAALVVPNDRGTGPAPGDWRLLQWNFAGPFGINAPEAW